MNDVSMLCDALSAETKQRMLYRDLRSFFHRLDLYIESFGEVGAAMIYTPENIRVRSSRHTTLLSNRIQCLIDIIVSLGIRESTKTGERLVN
jgi:hypothetical protein